MKTYLRTKINTKEEISIRLLISRSILCEYTKVKLIIRSWSIESRGGGWLSLVRNIVTNQSFLDRVDLRFIREIHRDLALFTISFAAGRSRWIGGKFDQRWRNLVQILEREDDCRSRPRVWSRQYTVQSSCGFW